MRCSSCIFKWLWQQIFKTMRGVVSYVKIEIKRNQTTIIGIQTLFCMFELLGIFPLDAVHAEAIYLMKFLSHILFFFCWCLPSFVFCFFFFLYKLWWTDKTQCWGQDFLALVRGWGFLAFALERQKERGIEVTFLPEDKHLLRSSWIKFTAWQKLLVVPIHLWCLEEKSWQVRTHCPDWAHGWPSSGPFS